MKSRWLYWVAFALALVALALHLWSWLVEGDELVALDLFLPAFFAIFCLWALFAGHGSPRDADG